MRRILIVLSFLAATIGSVQGATLNFSFTAKQLLDGIDTTTDANCANPVSQSCAFYIFQATPVGGGTIMGGSSTAPDYAGLLYGASVYWTDNGLNTIVSFLTRHATPLTGNTFNSLSGQPSTVTAGPNVSETATFAVLLDKPGLLPGQTVTWDVVASGVNLDTGMEGSAKLSVQFQLSAEAQAVVPEPGTFLFAGMGLVAIGIICRSRLDGSNKNKRS